MDQKELSRKIEETPWDNQEKISVCLCTYNGAEFLGMQLASILAQTLLPNEIVVVDDCSIDETFEILQHFKQDFSSIFRIFVNSKNLGYKANYARALSLSKGSIIFFADQDDVWEKNKIEKFVRALRNNPQKNSVCCSLDLIDDFGNYLGLSSYNSQMISMGKRKEQWKAFYKHPLIPGTAFAIRRSLLDKYWPIPSGFLHDEWFSLCSSVENGVFYIPEVLVHYRQHKGQAIGDRRKSFSEKKSWQADFLGINTKYQIVCVSNLFPQSVREAFRDRSLFFIFRESQKRKRFFAAFFNLLFHPKYFFAYFAFCNSPFLSMGKDLIVFRKEN